MTAERHRTARCVLAAIACVALPGCMAVHIASPDGVRVVRHVGVLRIDLPTPDGAVVGTLSGVGVAGTPLGWSAGYTRQRWAAMGPECRAVLWIDDPVELDERTRRSLTGIAGLCLVEDRSAFLSQLKETAR